jgi:ABC-2 type transport system permease protein
MTTTATTARPATEEVLRQVLAVSARPPKASALWASRTFAWRALVKIKYVQDQLGNAVVFPVVLTLAFTFLLGGAISGSPQAYLQFFLPGVLVITVVSTSMSSALTLNRDISTGVFDRVRSLPIWQPSVLVGAMLADVVRYALASVVPLLLGLVLGFRPQGGAGGVVLALLFLQLFTFSLAWMWILLAVLIKEPTAAQGVIYLLQFFLMFGSNFIAPAQTMPSWMQTVVDLNPVSHAVTAVRGLMHGTATTAELSGGFLACAVLVVLFAPPAIYLYNRKQH